MNTRTIQMGLRAKQLMTKIADRVTDERGDVLGWMIGVVVVALAAVVLWTAWDAIFDTEVAKLEGIGEVSVGG